VQSVFASLPDRASEFVGQFWQTFVIAPIAVEYWPDRQLVQAASPGSILYLPATHCTQVPPLNPVNTGLHTQSLTWALEIGDIESAWHAWQTSDPAPTAVEYFPTAHWLHSAVPRAALNFPATQMRHDSPSGPVNPGLQVQLVMTLLASGEFEFDEHGTQTSEIAPIVIEYCPAIQLLHAAGPFSSLYLPATHS